MPIRGSPNGARHLRPQAGRNRPEWVVAINRNAWSQSIGIAGRDHPVRAPELRGRHQGSSGRQERPPSHRQWPAETAMGKGRRQPGDVVSAQSSEGRDELSRGP
jgi:hypothetical protein